MSKLHKLVLYPTLAMAGIVAALLGAAAGNFADACSSQPAQSAITELQAQNNAPHKEVADSKRSASASSDNASTSSVPSAETKDKKKNKKNDKAKPAPSDQEEQFKKELLGIYG